MIKQTVYCLLFIFLAAGCTEKVDVKLDDTYTRLVVDGNIETDTGAYSVTLTRSANYFYNEPAQKVVNAILELTNGDTTFILHETEEGKSGVYNTDSTFSGTIGKTYTLTISLPEVIGGTDTYTSSCALRQVAHLDSIKAIFHPDWGKEGFWTVKLWAQEPGDETNYYLFNLYRNGKLLTDTINKKVISDDAFYNGSYMNGVDAVYLNHAHKWETIFPGDTITLQMSGITKEYHGFIAQVQQAGFTIPFFSGPPANVQGNISDGGIGFFAAFSNSYASTIVPNFSK